MTMTESRNLATPDILCKPGAHWFQNTRPPPDGTNIQLFVKLDFISQ